MLPGAGVKGAIIAPCGSVITANRPTVGMSVGGTMTLAPSSPGARHGGVGVGHRDVGQPVRVAPPATVSGGITMMPAIGLSPAVHIV